MKDILKNKFLSKLHTEDKAGLYITVTVHVMALIVLLASQISSAVKTDSSYLFDFSHIEEAERQEEEARFRETIDRRLDELIAAAPVASSEIRNIAVDASNLSDDRNTDVEALYRDAERLAAELKRLLPSVTCMCTGEESSTPDISFVVFSPILPFPA